MRLFRAKPDITNAGDARYRVTQRGYQPAWQRQNLPDPAAMNYSWETLGLVQFSPIGPSVTVRNPFSTLFSQMFAGLTVKLTGVPLVQGQIIGQPIFDPNSGYTAERQQPLPNAQISMNIPVSIPHAMPFNEPYPERL